MLSEINIENFALMEKVQLNFSLGLSIFSGETGAGKSMLIDSLSVLLGGRANSDFIRHGMDKAVLEGIFDQLPPVVLERLKEAGYSPEEGQLFLAREINQNGRNICRIQGRTVPLSLYRTLVQGLVDIHGQMEHQSLFQSETHKGLLDAFGGAEHLKLIEEVDQAAARYRSLLKREKQLVISETERERREDLLRYQIDEIARINPKPGEEELLLEERKRLANAEKILKFSSELYVTLFEGLGNKNSAYDLLGRCQKNLTDLIRLDERCTKLLEPLETVYFQIEDLASQVNDYREEFDFESGHYDRLEERLIELRRLHKYGQSAEAILQLQAEMMQELHQITHLQEELEVLRVEKSNAHKTYIAKAKGLSEQREKHAQRLVEGMHKELADLALAKSRFEVQFTPLKEPSAGGAEDVEFFFTANVGEPLKPLAKVASGGEMSRLTLALKSLLTQIENVGTFVFDEVDSGVGGRTIQKVGEKLALIAQNKQVFCITHAPQVAAFGDQHFGIFKEVSNDRTRSLVQVLTEKERVHELARMLGGDEASIALEHAQALWKNAHLRGAVNK